MTQQVSGAGAGRESARLLTAGRAHLGSTRERGKQERQVSDIHDTISGILSFVGATAGLCLVKTQCIEEKYQQRKSKPVTVRRRSHWGQGRTVALRQASGFW